jgi:hypothetical protein
LKLDAIVEAVAEQLPSEVDPEVQRRKEKYERTGLRYLLTAGVIALVLSVLLYTQYTNLGYFFGSVLLGTVVAWFWFFLAPALGFLYYGKVYLKPKHLPRDEVPATTGVTSRLIEDRPFDYVSSVTEDTTKSLHVRRDESGGKKRP